MRMLWRSFLCSGLLTGERNCDARVLCSRLGFLRSVLFNDEVKAPGQPKPAARSAHVMFEDAAGLRSALTTDTRNTRQPHSRGSLETGMQSEPRIVALLSAASRAGSHLLLRVCSAEWLSEYKAVRPDPDKLQDQVNRCALPCWNAVVI